MKLAAALFAAALLAVGCAPQEEQPDIPLSTQSRFLVYTPDSLNDVGRSPSVVLNEEGNPVVGYLLLKAVLREGDIPPPVVPGQPQPPALMLASLSTEGVWQRVSVTPQKTSPAEGDAPEIANKDKEAGPAVHTGLAIDGQGTHHLAWSTPRGVFYITDAGGSFVEPQTVARGEALGASIAVGEDGTPWVSFYSQGSVRVATRSGTAWQAQTVGRARPPANPWTATTAVRVGGDGQPAVAYGDDGATVVATRSGGGWSPERVPGEGGVAVSLALDQDGNPHTAYYDANGAVRHSHSIGGAAWETTDIGSTRASERQLALWGTGIDLDDEGIHHVVWTDTTNQRIELATNRGGEFSSEPVINSESGGNPSIAVSGDGRSLGMAWYDALEGDLAVATSGRQQLALAFSPQNPSRPSPQAPQQTTDPQCQPEGGATELQISAPSGAAASGFDKTCLAIGANEDFSVTFTNDDPQVPHNWSLYVDSAAQARPEGAPNDFELITGPAETTYEVPALDPGEYFYRCDAHPTTMTGQLIAAEP